MNNYQASLAAQLIELEQELKYAEAFALGDPVATANIARANNELNSAFTVFNQITSVAEREITTTEANAVSARLTNIYDILANPKAPISGIAISATPPVLLNTRTAPIITGGTRAFEIGMWAAAIVPGIVLQVKKNKARKYFDALDRRIKFNAAQIDGFIAKRLNILRNSAWFDTALFPELATINLSDSTPDGARNTLTGYLDRAYEIIVERAIAANSGIIPADLQSTLQADRKVQREITAARTLYNDTVNMWNKDIFGDRAKEIVAANLKLTTRPVFVGSRTGTKLALNRAY